MRCEARGARLSALLDASIVIASTLLAATGAPAASTLDRTGRFAIQWWTVDDGLPEAPVNGVAFAPDGTLCCTTPTRIARFDGVSFRELLEGRTPADWRDAVYYRYWEHDSGEHPVPNNFGIRTATHKLICYQGQPHGMKGASPKPTPEEWELFDLVKDPRELRNVYDDPAYAEVRARLTARLSAERERIGDTR